MCDLILKPLLQTGDKTVQKSTIQHIESVGFNFQCMGKSIKKKTFLFLKKVEQTAETESGKRRKLNQEQTQPLEPSGSNTQRDEGCLQTSEKPATPSSNFPNKVPLSSSQCLPHPEAYYWTHHSLGKMSHRTTKISLMLVNSSLSNYVSESLWY